MRSPASKSCFEIRRSAREGQKAQLDQRIAQLQEQIQGVNDQIVAKKRELELIQKELKGVHELWQKNLVPITRVTSLERDAARLEGERGSLVSTVAQAKGKITETELQIIQVDQDMRTEIGKELAEIRGKTAELTEKKVAAEDQLKRVDIRAPQDGAVHELAVHTVGGVVGEGETIMLIVPKDETLMVEVKIAPQDIDQVHLGQKAVLRFSAFNQRTTPELDGEVTRVSADISQDQKTGTSYYTTRISVAEEQIARLNGLKLVPGMPVETFIQTNPRFAAAWRSGGRGLAACARNQPACFAGQWARAITTGHARPARMARLGEPTFHTDGLSPTREPRESHRNTAIYPISPCAQPAKRYPRLPGRC